MPSILALLSLLPARAHSSFALLDPADAEPHFASLPEVGGITGAAAFAFAQQELPFIDLPAAEADLVAAYYYRTKVLREHILDTGYPDAPFVVSECKFATTRMNSSSHQPVDGAVGCGWGDAKGVINAASGHHIAEGSWLRSSKYINSYLRYFFKGAHTPDGKKASTQNPRSYSSWQTFAALKKFKNDGDLAFIASLLPSFLTNFQGWVEGHRLDRRGQAGCAGANVDPESGASSLLESCFT